MHALNRTQIDIAITHGAIQTANTILGDAQDMLMAMKLPAAIMAHRTHIEFLSQDLRELHLQLEMLMARLDRLENLVTPDEEALATAISDKPSNVIVGPSRALRVMGAMKRLVPDALVNKVATCSAKYETYRVSNGEGDLSINVRFDKYDRIESGTLSWFPIKWAKPVPAPPKDRTAYQRETYAIVNEMGISKDDVHADLKPAHGVTSTTKMTAQQMRNVRNAYKAARGLMNRCDRQWPGSGMQVIEKICQAHQIAVHQLHRIQPKHFNIELTPRDIESALYATEAA